MTAEASGTPAARGPFVVSRIPPDDVRQLVVESRWPLAVAVEAAVVNRGGWHVLERDGDVL